MRFAIRMRYAALSMALATFLCAADKKVLFDFRPSHGKTDAAATLSAEARRNILSAVFPRYLRDGRQCKVKPDEPSTDAALEAARNSGQIVPEVLSLAAGSFTRSGARQTAYLIKVGECGADEGRSYFGTYRLVVFDNNRLVGSGQSPVGDHIATTADVVGDGIEEILTSGCGFGQGIEECSASLVSMAGGSLRTIQDFISAYSDDCWSSKDSGISASLIRYVPGHPPQFFQEEYKAACPGSGQEPQFRPAAAGKP